MFEDTEPRREPAVRWMTGQPGDALLFLSADRQSLLIPWDINIALKYADAEMVIPYTEMDRQALIAFRSALEIFKTPLGSKLEISPATPYPLFLSYVEALGDFDILCRDIGATQAVTALRAVKDGEEIAIYRELSQITNEMIDHLEEGVRSGKLKTEMDAALFIETEARKRGCEGTGFETLAAGSGRSFGIHAFPAYTAGEFARQGLSILDFGLKLRGYTSDVTMSFACPPLSKAQERLLTLTEKAYKTGLSLVLPGMEARNIAAAVDNFFGKARKIMPHGLGHGIGLEAHEGPAIRNRCSNDWILTPGMIFTLEPGLYDPAQGGCRLENDILVTETGYEVLTQSRIVRL
ncbi:MAG: Xaa-Pro peptidase family protein [Treponema sp.]|nr:Xaa-Pro peptidase family protein [Treponema sp.]